MNITELENLVIAGRVSCPSCLAALAALASDADGELACPCGFQFIAAEDFVIAPAPAASVTAPIVAELEAARGVMQTMISQGFSLQTRQLQERRINRLKSALAKAQGAERRAATTVAFAAVELGLNVADLLRNLPRGYGQATRLSALELTVLRNAYGA